jgi:hypothetical protein
MSARKPLVIVAGQIQQLQAGDTLDATVNEMENIALTNDESADAIVIGMAVFFDADDGCKMAKADSAGTALVAAMCITDSVGTGVTGIFITDGVVVATTGQWDAVAGTTGGLVAGTTYYLSPTDFGEITAVAPAAVGQLVVEIGTAISKTKLKLEIESPILL